MSSVRSGVLWDYAGSLSTQLVSFGISVVLARLLSPAEYGIISIAMVVISVATVFATMGFGASIINARDLDHKAINSIFIINVVIGVLLTVLCVFGAPYVGEFYESPSLTPVLQVLAVVFIFSTLQTVQQSLITRDMRFRVLAWRQVGTSLVGGLVGIVMAYHGMGVWALVGQTLTANFLNTLFFWFASSWRPDFSFSFGALRPYWRYSNKLFASSLLDTVYTRLDVLFFGKIFPLSTVGNFNRARSFNQLIVRNSSQSIMRVLFPYLSKLKGNLEEMRITTGKGLHVICFLAFGLIAIFASCGHDLILFLYSDAWAGAIPIFYWLILGSFAYPISALLVNVIRGNGNSKLFLQIEIIKKTISTAAFYFGWRYGIIAFLQVLLIAQVINVLVNVYAVAQEIKLSVFFQIKIIAVYAFGSLCVLILIRSLNSHTDTGMLWLNIIHQGGLAVILFGLYNLSLKTTGLNYFIGILKPYLSKIIASL